MIKEKDLVEWRPGCRYSEGASVDLYALRDVVTEKANALGVRVAFIMDEVKYGGLIGGSTEPCLVIYHPDHENDYCKLCATVKHEGIYAFLNVYSFGNSKQMNNAACLDARRDIYKNGSMSEKLGAAIGGGIRNLIMGSTNKQKIQEEQMWYAVVSDIFDEIMS